MWTSRCPVVALRAFVTGGAGFIGRHLVRVLLDGGWRVKAFILESERSHLPKDANLEPVVGDITRPSTLRGELDDADAVFHLAALVDSWVRDPQDYIRVNVEGTGHVVDESLRAAVPRFLFTSSMSGIGVTPGIVMREDSPPGKSFGPYEGSKADAERLVAKAVRERGLPAITLIPSIVIGPGDTRNTGKFLLSYVNGDFPGTFAESSVLPVVDADDVARAHLAAYHHGQLGERYIISGENVLWGDLLRMASVASGTPMPSRHIGGRALRFAARTGELFSRVTRSPPRLPSWLADFLLTGASMDNGKSVRELGMTYRPIHQSIRDSIAWFRDEGLFRGPPLPAAPEREVLVPVENPRVGAETVFELGIPETSSRDAPPNRRPKPPEGSA
ncbi:MAG: NAD-dependent epimerase/dehydratase family protein [Methanobacteriota archaeon]|nr:MAG: NAD-dependent epimerase/dehydratase family protein [Euryarchaeota archaeon]